MKTVLMNYMGRNNSAPYFTYSIAKALSSCGYDVIAIISKYATNVDDWNNYGFRKIYLVDTYTSWFNIAIKSIKFICYGKRNIAEEFINEKVDFVINTFFHPWSNMITSLFVNATVITFCHDPIQHDGVNIIMKLMYPFFIKKGDEIVVLTKDFTSIVQNKYEKNEKNIHYCPHGRMDLYKIKQCSCRPKGFPKYRENYTNFVFFGRIEKYKGLETLGRAYEIVKQKYNDISLTIYGSGDFSEYERFFCTEDVTIVNEYIKDCEVGWIFEGDNVVLVLPYDGATQSGVIPIAFEYSIPIICSDLVGLREQLSGGEVGLFFDPEDEQSLSESMQVYIEDKAFLESQSIKMGRMSKKIEWDQIIAKLMNEVDRYKCH